MEDYLDSLGNHLIESFNLVRSSTGRARSSLRRPLEKQDMKFSKCRQASAILDGIALIRFSIIQKYVDPERQSLESRILAC